MTTLQKVKISLVDEIHSYCGSTLSSRDLIACPGHRSSTWPLRSSGLEHQTTFAIAPCVSHYSSLIGVLYYEGSAANGVRITDYVEEIKDRAAFEKFIAGNGPDDHVLKVWVGHSLTRSHRPLVRGAAG